MPRRSLPGHDLLHARARSQPSKLRTFPSCSELLECAAAAGDPVEWIAIGRRRGPWRHAPLSATVPHEFPSEPTLMGELLARFGLSESLSNSVERRQGSLDHGRKGDDTHRPRVPDGLGEFVRVPGDGRFL